MVHENGTGSYQADPAGAVSSGGAVDVSAGKHVERPITLTPATATKIFQAARAAEIPIVCVTYGYNEGQDPRALPCDAFIDSFTELPALLRLKT